MSTSVQDLVGRAEEFEHDGQIYQLSQIRIRDLAELERWAQGEPLREVRETILQLGEVLTPQQRTEMIEAARTRGRALRIWQPEVLEMIQSLDGLAEWLFLALRIKHPDMTREKASAMPAANAEEIKALLKDLSGWVGDLGKGPAPAETATPPAATSTGATSSAA